MCGFFLLLFWVLFRPEVLEVKIMALYKVASLCLLQFISPRVVPPPDPSLSLPVLVLPVQRFLAQ